WPGGRRRDARLAQGRHSRHRGLAASEIVRSTQASGIKRSWAGRLMSELAREAIGALAACLTTCAFLPQALHVLKSRDTAALSLTMYLTFGSGAALWLVYGVMLGSWPIIIANIVTLSLVVLILLLKLRFG